MLDAMALCSLMVFNLHQSPLRNSIEPVSDEANGCKSTHPWVCSQRREFLYTVERLAFDIAIGVNFHFAVPSNCFAKLMSGGWLMIKFVTPPITG
jgi:hypothetical protein